jgi:hypothetical protein
LYFHAFILSYLYLHVKWVFNLFFAAVPPYIPSPKGFFLKGFTAVLTNDFEDFHNPSKPCQPYYALTLPPISVENLLIIYQKK